MNGNLSLNSASSNILNNQQYYLSSMTKQMGNVDLTSQIDRLGGQLDASRDNILHSHENTSRLLENQKQVFDILNDEQKRLLKKKDNIDNVLDGQKRILSFNENYRLRIADYTTLMLIIIACIITIFCIYRISKRFPAVQSIFELLMIVVIFFFIHRLYFKYLDILSRDNVNYNELKFTPPLTMSPDEIKQQQTENAKTGNLLGTINLGLCLGSYCCSKGTTWDIATGTCIPNKTGFSNMSGNVDANYPNEFDRYSKI
jgi:hypothetical protein